MLSSVESAEIDYGYGDDNSNDPFECLDDSTHSKKKSKSRLKQFWNKSKRHLCRSKSSKIEAIIDVPSQTQNKNQLEWPGRPARRRASM